MAVRTVMFHVRSDIKHDGRGGESGGERCLPNVLREAGMAEARPGLPCARVPAILGTCG